VIQCRTAEEIESAWADGKTAALLSIEGGELLDCDLDKLEEVYHWGVRAINLTWNYTNELSGTNVEDKEKGLTEQGRAFVVKMQRLGMLVDVSHLSDPGFWDVIDLAKKPIIATHSNSRAVCPHTRNLTDEQFKALIKNGGVAGLNMCDEFVGEAPTVDTLVAHVEHWFSLGGEHNVSLGGDWDGISGMPAGMHGVQDLDKLAERLLHMNYNEDKVRGIFYQNLMRVVKEVCTM
ncbi:MAG: dipeptidase, partial [Oscillospiraceae bacterium]|nr:dipeptidase [Oscillospiraceae bacterium]